MAEKDPDFFTPERQAAMTVEELKDVFRADDGSDPMPALELHAAIANRYGRDMLAMGLTAEEICPQSARSQINRCRPSSECWII